ncbi:Hypothetical protein A7982_06901 [Minicystis rosea]|nr:Hypothetical protein A7982_06901 [Minicystis rosea]
MDVKHTAQCPKCDGRRIMRIHRVADAAEWTGTGDGDLSSRSGTSPVARRVLVRRRTSTGLFGGTNESFELAGEVEAYACADCGYLEEYLRHPERIDWNEIVEAYPHTVKGTGGPFR